MRRIYSLLVAVCMCSSLMINAQSQSQNPDSAMNIMTSPGTMAWSITNPLNHNGTNFTNAPTLLGCSNCSSQELHMYDCGFSIPGAATIVGIEMVYARGGCNAGSFFQELLGVSQKGTRLGTAKGWTTGNAALDTAGGPTDMWGTSLTPSDVNSSNFGAYVMGRAQGICTYQVASLEITIYYTVVTGVVESQTRKVKLYPNPAVSQITVEVDPQVSGKSYSIYDLTGKRIKTGIVTTTTENIKLDGFNKGLYFLQIEGEKALTKFTVK